MSSSLSLTLTGCSNTGAISADVSDTATEDASVGSLVGAVASATKLHLEDVTAGGTVSATVAEGRTAKVGAFVGEAFAYDASTEAGLWLTGQALTALPQFAETLATVGGYTATKTEGDYTVYYVQAASEWAEVEQGQIGDIPAADKDAVEDNLALIRTALSTNEAAAVGDWLTKVYGNTKVPAATVKDARNIGVSVKYDLPLMTNDTPTVEVADAEVTAASGNVAAFSFTIKDGTESVSVTAAKIQNMVQWTDSLSNPFAVSTSTQVQVTAAGDGKSFKAELKPVAGKTSGFMKVVLEP